MASAWQTMEEAALTLGVSSRTLHRRITKGEVKTRLNNGRREVLVEISEPEPAAEMSAGGQTPSDGVSVGVEEPSAGDHELPEHVSHAVLAIHEDRLRRTDLAIMAYQQSVNVAAADARRLRVGSRVAWSLTGAMAVALTLSVIWATHRLTKASADVQNLSTQLQTLSATTDVKIREADSLRRDAEFARISAARAEGELAAKRAAEAKKKEEPATRPTGLRAWLGF
ncbi:MAG: hypothetical protein IT446_08395 [Phycisphaerales bacterium]|nr:hypothetical protein [Phycisphaerales bacterium]